MAVHSFTPQSAVASFFLAFLLCLQYAAAQTGSVYQLDSEYSGTNFFDGWDFYTGGDTTSGFVTYYSRSSAQSAGMIDSTTNQSVYVGSDYTSYISSATAAGRPSVRISSKRSWTHGLFIGDFNHAPGGVCGTWPAFWTLGPNWPYTGEIDIMEGANLNNYNGITLHSSPNCTIAGDSRTMTGDLQTNNCAYYPDYYVGCSISDQRASAYGSTFNQNGGGVYAMQWTSDYIRVWFFSRGAIPSDITNLTPNPSSWGLPAADFEGGCVIDQHFQDHKIVLNNDFCGQYAGTASVWNSSSNSCAAQTGYSTCAGYVAAQPAAFKEAYWSINSIRVYQLVNSSTNTSSSSAYIASLQPTSATAVGSSGPTPTVSPGTSLCPAYNFTVVQSGNLDYEIVCGFNPGGQDIGAPNGHWTVNSFEDCVAGCSYWNNNITTNICAGVTYSVSGKACYWKSSITSDPLAPGYNGARLIYYAYLQVTDNPNNQTATSTTSSSSYVFTSVPPNTYVNPSAASTTSFSLNTETPASSLTDGVGMGGGATTTSTVGAGTSSSTVSSPTSSASSVTSATTTTTGTLSSTGVTSSVTSVSSSSSATTPAITTSSTVVQSSSTTSTRTSTVPSSTTTSFSTSSLGSSTTLSATTTPQTSQASSQLSSTTTMSLATTTTVLSSPQVSTSTARSSTTSTVQTSQSTAQTTSVGASSSQTSGSTQQSTVATITSASSSSSPSPSPSSSVAASSTTSAVLSSQMQTQTSTSQTSPGLSATSTTSTTSTTTSASASSPIQTSPASSSPTTSSSQTSPSIPISRSPTTSPPSSQQSTSPSPQSLPPSSSLTSTLSSSPTTTTTTSSSSTTTAFPTQVSSFAFAGCLGPVPDSAFTDSFLLAQTSENMTIDSCVDDCAGQQYAGIFDTQCFCSDYVGAPPSSEVAVYPDEDCDTPCPGDPAQMCGGVAGVSPTRFVKRQASTSGTNGDGNAVLLITVYNNTQAVLPGGSSSLTMTTTTTSATMRSSSTVLQGSSTVESTSSLSGMSASSSQVQSQSLGPVLMSTTPLSSQIEASPSSSSLSLLLSPTTISTPYTTICAADPYTCPAPTAVCLTTTITVLHCGCTDMPEPTVPMTTTVVPCASDAAEEPTATTLTVPCAASISSMQNEVSSWFASATAAAPGRVNVAESVPAPATAAAAASSHPYHPYSFPISFTMTTASPALVSESVSAPGAEASPHTTVTLTMTVAPVLNKTSGSAFANNSNVSGPASVGGIKSVVGPTTSVPGSGPHGGEVRSGAVQVQARLVMNGFTAAVVSTLVLVLLRFGVDGF